MTVVCVAGMHRSGTSMITQMLHLCGLYLGEETDLLPPHPDNPEGYWENRNFMELNDELLSFLGGSWYLPPDSKLFLGTEHDLSNLVSKARKLVDLFTDKPFWGWKDPRNSITLPFWQSLIPDLKIIISLRNPAEVVQSISRRDRFPEIFSFRLWQEYNQRLMNSIPSTNRLITHYNVYFSDPEAELRRLLKFTGIQVDDGVIKNACRATFSSLKRNRATFGNLIQTGAPFEVINLYTDMCLQAGQPYLETPNKTDIQLLPDDAEHLDSEVEQELLSKFMKKDPLLQSMSQWIAKKQRQIEQLSEQEQLLANQITEQEQLFTNQITELETTVSTLSTQVAEKEQIVQVLTAQVAEKEAQIAEIHNSKAWKLVLFLRQIRMILFPPR